MTIIRKILDLFKKPTTTNPAPFTPAFTTYTRSPKTEQYYRREKIKKENNLNISYQDVAIYDMKPFSLKQPFLSDNFFTCIALNSYNLNKAYDYLHIANAIIKPFYQYFNDAILPNRIDIGYMYEQKVPISHLRL